MNNLTQATILPVTEIRNIFVALILGMGMFYMVAMAPINAVHDAAHDTRHSILAPCH